MSTCTVNYIQEALISEEEKERLTKIHLDLSKRLYQHRVTNFSNVEKLFKFAGNKLYTSTSKIYYDSADGLVKSLNLELGFEGVKLIQDPNVAIRAYVSVNVLPELSNTVEINDISKIHPFYKLYFGSSSIVTEEGSELLTTVEEHPQVFNNLTDNLMQKINLYLNGSKSSGDRFSYNKTKYELIKLKGLLKDKGTASVISGLSQYIVNSSNNLVDIKKRLAIIEDKIKNLDEDDAIRKNQLTQVSDFVKQSSHYYHLFDVLEDIAREFTTLGITPNKIDNYERDLLESDLKQWLESKELFSENEIIDFLNKVPSEINNSGNIFNQFKALYREKVEQLSSEEADVLEDEMLTIFNKNMKSEGGIQQQLENTLHQLRVFKSKLKDLHYETLTKIYYPAFTKSFDSDKMSIDGKMSVEDKWKMSEEDFKALLKIGEQDIDSIAMWASAMINVSDTVAVTIANYFKEVMIDIDLNNKKDVGDMQVFLTKNNKTQEDLKEIHQNATSDNLTIEELTPVDDTYTPEEGYAVITGYMLGIGGKYKARKTRNLLSEFDQVSYANNKKIFTHHLELVLNDYTNALSGDKYGLANLETSNDPILRNVFNSLYVKKSDVFIRNNIAKFLNENPTQNEIKNKLKSIFWQSFYKENITIKPEDQIKDILIDHNILKSGNLVDFNQDVNYNALQYTLQNSLWSTYKNVEKGNYKSSTLKDRFYHSPNSLFGVYNNDVKQVLVRYDDLTYGYVELINVEDEIVLFNNSEKEIYEFATFSKDFNSLADKYNVKYSGNASKWNYLQSTDFNRQYFNRLKNTYKDANTNYRYEALVNNEVPQVNKLEESSRLQKIKDTYSKVKDGNGFEMFTQYLNTFTIEEDKHPLMKNGQLVDEEGNPTENPVYVSKEKQYINGQRVRDIQAKFISPIPIEEIEEDLYKSILLYKTASNVYRGLKDNESQALLLQTILEGDDTLGIEKRKMKVQGVRIAGGGGVKLKDHDVLSSKMILSFINSYVYGIENEDYGIFNSKISAKKVAGLVSKYTAFTALSWNIMTMPSNRAVALHNMRAVAKGNEFFNEQDWYKAVRVYQDNIPNFMNDFRQKGFTNEKSLLSQMIVRFSAIQGEFMSPDGIIVTKDLGEKLSDNAWFWTQEIVEHTNQTNSMVMMMMGYKLPSGISLWKAIEDANINRKDGDQLIMPEEFTRDLEIQFQKKLQGVNRVIHGNYAKLDKTMLQKSILTNMMMTFKKYIYDGFRSRFMSERYDQELRDEQEGYFRTYLKALNKEYLEVSKANAFSVTPSLLKTVGKTLLKTTLGAWDAAISTPWTGRLSDKNKDVQNYLYDRDNITERQYYAAMRATYDMGNIVRLMLISIAVEAIMSGLDDDDEWTKFALSYVDIYAKRLESDIGFFTSFTNFATGSYAGATLDQTIKTLKQPFAGVRAMDTTAGMFKQLISFDYVNDDGEFELQWGALDKYEKSGNGFEKGDYKIAKKAQKSLIAPVAQVMRLADPDQILSYQNMLFKYSK